MDEDEGVVVIKEFEFEDADAEELKEAVDFVNAVNAWTICPCGDHLVKDQPAGNGICYFCEMTTHKDDEETRFCPICHEEGRLRWMVETPCCHQHLHRKCKDSCVATAAVRLQDAQCPMCRAAW